MGGPSWGNFLMFLGCLFQDRFLIVLGSVFGLIWGPFWHYNRAQIEEKTGLILGSIFGASLGANEGNKTLCARARFQQEKMKRLEIQQVNKKKTQLFLSLFRLLLTFAHHCSDYC